MGVYCFTAMLERYFMNIGLGIDTGGTYTDAVIYDFNVNSIKAVSKTLTEKNNLEGCISRTLDGLPRDLLKKVNAVSLSTTLATNACIEGRGGQARLILIGCDRKVAVSYGSEYGLPPASEIIFLDGGHDRKGNIVEEPDWNFLKDTVTRSMKDYEAYAVVEIWGMNNCDYELRTKELISEWTGCRIVCGHELTARLNLFKRAASALLNAQLIPIVGEFMDSIGKNLRNRGIDAPLTIMRGDGSLMSADFAREKPVETLLCGPAASIEGGLNLTDEKNCVVIDMGGTTSDMAIIKNGVAGIADEGASVGKWRTGTHSILIETTGLGGDSRINFDSNYNIILGPERVEPLSAAASKWPYVRKRAKEIFDMGKKYIFPLCEFLYSTSIPDEAKGFSKSEIGIAETIYQNPMDVASLTKALGLSMTSGETARLERLGIVTRIGLTPTDMMHVSGDYTEWDREAAHYGVGTLASQLGMDEGTLISEVYKLVREGLFLGISKILIEDEDPSLLDDGMSGPLKSLLLNGFRKALGMMGNGRIHNFESTISTDYSLVGIGAPIHVFIGDVAKAMKTKCIIPENAAVANAVGAITGKIRSERTATVTPQYTSSGISGFSVFAWGLRRQFKEYENALEWAREAASGAAMETNEKKGAVETTVSVSVKENTARPSATKGATPSVCGTREKCKGCIGNIEECSESDGEIMLDTIVSAVATGNPSWHSFS